MLWAMYCISLWYYSWNTTYKAIPPVEANFREQIKQTCLLYVGHAQSSVPNSSCFLDSLFVFLGYVTVVTSAPQRFQWLLEPAFWCSVLPLVSRGTPSWGILFRDRSMLRIDFAVTCTAVQLSSSPNYGSTTIYAAYTVVLSRFPAAFSFCFLGWCWCNRIQRDSGMWHKIAELRTRHVQLGCTERRSLYGKNGLSFFEGEDHLIIV